MPHRMINRRSRQGVSCWRFPRTLILGLGLVGCATTPQAHTTLPGPAWPDLPPRPALVEAPAPTASPDYSTLPNHVLKRTTWTQAKPRLTDIKPMVPIRFITIHHDALPLPAVSSMAGVKARLELIRRAHTKDRGWSDIGYHFAVDRAGRVWEARSLKYQGAHVKNHNEGNIGIVLLGNFELSTPTAPQINALNRLVRGFRSIYRIPLQNVRCHQEWSGAVTACPGKSLARYVTKARKNGKFGS